MKTKIVRFTVLAATVVAMLAFAASTSLAATGTFTSSADIAVPASGSANNMGKASPYPSALQVGGLTGTEITDVDVTLDGVTHTFPDDLDVLLVGPRGQRVVLMSDAGGNPDISNVDLTFSDQASATLRDGSSLNFGTKLASGTYKPTDYESGESLPPPAPAGPYSGSLSAFDQTDPNGAWRLYVNDDGSGDRGSIGGFSLAISTRPAVDRLKVTTTSDTANDDDVISLREAITFANNTTGADTITFAIPESEKANGRWKINLASELPALSDPVSVTGPGADGLAVDRDSAGDFRIFTVNTGVSATISGLTASNGRAADGGGIYSHGTLTLDGVTLAGNTANGSGSFGFGGGVYNDHGTLTIKNDSKVQNNAVNTFYGGGVYNEGGRVTVDGSAITGNSAPSDKNGGGVYTYDGGTVTIRNGSTVSSNTAGFGGGIFVSDGTVNVLNSTIRANAAQADANSGGIYNDAALTISGSTISANSGGIHNWGSLTATNSTISNNIARGLYARSRTSAPLGSATLANVTVADNGTGISRVEGTLEIQNTLLANAGSNCSGAITSKGNNLSDDTSCSTTFVASDLGNRQINASNFGPLQNNGGPTETHALLPGNPAIDAGADAVTDPPLNLTTDQRGAGFPRKRHEHVDIGALEQAVAPETTITAGPDGPTNDPTPEFRFSSNDAAATFECSVDGAAFAACSSPFTTSALADGDHSFEVGAKGAGGTDASPASRSFTVDTQTPGVSLDTPADDSFTNDPTPVFSGAAGNAPGDGSDVTVKVYAGTAATGAPVATLPATRENNSFSVSPTGPLPDGAYAVVAEQGDHAGNTGRSAPRLFTVDTEPPLVEITAGPAGETGDSTPTFEFTSENGATLVCALDGTNVSPCVSPFAAQRLADGDHTFEVGATDGAGNTATATRPFSVNSPPPLADDDAYATDEDGSLTVGPGEGLLAGDTDAENDTLSVVDEDAGLAGVQPASGPAHGTLTLEEDGSFAYTPGNDLNGDDSFTYRTTDGSKKSAAATVTLTVHPVNDAPSFGPVADQTIDEDPDPRVQAVPGFASSISPGPVDEDGQGVSFEVSDDDAALFAPGGRPGISPDGTLAYEPAVDANGTATVTVTAVDTGGTDRGGVDRSGTETFAVKVNAVNDLPVPEDDRRFTPEDVPLVLAASDLTTNDDAGPDDEEQVQKLYVKEVRDGENGQVKLEEGEITFTPDPGFNGRATFLYRVCDDGTPERCSVERATVFVAVSPVNTAPTAADGSYALDEDTGPVEIDFGALSYDAETADADLSYEVAAPDPAKGTLTGNGPVRRFTPSPDSNGLVEIPYTVTDRGDPDGCGVPDEACAAPKASGTGKVSVTVRPVDDDPSFQMGPDQTIDEDAGRQEIPGWATDISAGPGEVDQTVSFQLAADNPDLFSAQPRLTPNGTLVYTPARDANGGATVTVEITDKDAGPDGAAPQDARSLPSFGITVRPVNDAPKAADDAATTTDKAGGVNVDVLANDADVDAGDRLRVARFERPNRGTVTEEQDGTLTYVPDRGFSGEDDFLYTVSDGKGGTDVARVRVTVRDVTAPEVVGTTRFLKVRNDEGTIRIGAVFSESMDPATLDNGTFTLVEKGTNRRVAAQVRYDEKNRSALLTPNRFLENDTTYTARVEGGAGGAADVAGNPLEKSKVWSFTIRR